MRAACSVSTQKTMVFWNRSPLSFRNSVTLCAIRFDLLSVFVGLTLGRTVAFHIHIKMDFNHFIRRQEAITYALLEGIGVHGLAEVMDVRYVFGFLRRGGETDLGGT